ncbi:alpha-mannosidase [Fimbriimonadia bacterium ATM]|nr:MAG: alpha-mannosidase [Armatimonadota bacterium]MBC6968416.1 alpha-mannosidase [Armatimonadota bacterium]MCE7898746.1 alpha-mannosidase [Armatimonadetes bacterium ATM1]MDL1928757.1 alpha-mannosidase [Fimbriimonadia bacterium ATM]RIJ98464.1 MAG: hypothetical protein DCC45_01485 [Armatimonadota bacterium]
MSGAGDRPKTWHNSRRPQAPRTPMLKHPEITERRIDLFLRTELEPRVYGARQPLSIEFSSEAHRDAREAAKGKFAKVGPGYKWGPVWRTVWFRALGSIPRAWADREVAAQIEVGGERTVWKGSVPVWGLDGPHSWYAITPQARGGEKVEVYVEAYGTNPNVRVHGQFEDPKPKPFEVKGAWMAPFDRDLWQLLLDCKFCQNLMTTLPRGDAAREHILRALNAVVNQYDASRKQSVSECRKLIAEATSGRRVDLYHNVAPFGHAHLDSAWLWPVPITVKKMAHTTATQIALMDRYPEHLFVHSQPAQYEWLEQQYPKLFDLVKGKIASKQWEPVGAMWVEADTNVPSGESLVRQLLYGVRYFERKLGVRVKDLWLPDVFGYSAALPQILKKAGIDYFLTQKISWNQFNRFPHNTFWWQGIDGSRVWSHFPPADTYCGMCTPEELMKHVREHRDHGRCDYSAYVFGYGDGGGGPTAEHLEMLRRAKAAPGLPQISRMRASDFFQRAKEESRDLAVWSGELYFELHRGTYTTQANNKKYNRYAEFLLRDVELLSCFSPGFPTDYAAREIEDLWKRVLFNQFHDIIPGTSVQEVYRQTDREYASILETAERILGEKMEAIASSQSAPDQGQAYSMFQFADVPTEGRIPLTKKSGAKSIVCGDEEVPVQEIVEFGQRALVFKTPDAASGRVAVAVLSDRDREGDEKLRASGKKLQNEHWTIRFDSHGNLTSIVSTEDQCEYLQEGSLGNLFQLFEDKPLFWSAWDVDPYMLETGVDLVKSSRFEIVERGPVRVAAEVERRFGESRIVQRISLGPTPGIRFDTWIDWRESEKLLKVAFPVNVNPSRATYEIQFGNLERPTHRNTSWDAAKFEVCAHKWVDVSEGDHGVALINDSKYGHDVHENVIRLTLLRSPKAPDPNADMGVHRFTYVLMPHFGPYNWAGVVQAAYAINAPLRVRPLKPGKGTGAPTDKFVSCEDRNIVIEAVKKAEDDNSIVVRLYECHNARGAAELHCSKKVKSATLCNLLEEPVTSLAVQDGAVQFDYKPFEIITMKLEV